MQLALELQLLELLKPAQERRLKPLVVALELGPELGLQRESLDFEPALALEAPLLLWLLVEQQKQLELVVAELKLVELLRPRQKGRLNQLGVEPALMTGLPRELLVRLELQRPVKLGLLKLVALQLRELEPLKFEPALVLRPLQELLPLELMRLPGLEVRQLRLVIELQKQL